MKNRLQSHKYKTLLLLSVTGALLASSVFFISEAGAAGLSVKNTDSRGAHFSVEPNKAHKLNPKKTKNSSNQNIERLSNILSAARKKVAAESSVSVKIGASFGVANGHILEHSQGNITKNAGELEDLVIVGKKSGHLTQILSNGVAYCKGDVIGLEYGCGLNTSQANKAKNGWIAIPKSNILYKNAAGDMTISAAFSSMFPSSLTSYRLGKNVVINKVTSYSIYGTVPGTISSTLPKGVSENFYVAANGSYLPQKVELSTKGVAEVVDFSNWGKAATPKAPTKSTSINKL